MPKVLITDDDQKLLKMLKRTLAYENMDVLTASNGVEALEIVRDQQPDVMILDWMMPEMDGLELIERLRDMNKRLPILMLTARDAIEDRVDGLESGADDYLVKPFAPAELVARVHALLRRIETRPDDTVAQYGDLKLDPVQHEAWRGDRLLDLTVTEFNLLHYFLRHPRQVLERSQILTEVWGYDFGGDSNVLEIYISYLRKKIETEGEPRLIQTVRGIGYVLREE
ncbi:MAG: response regulator transcription factor [Anaerolineaceae bacterium]|jgi:two-component system response regulator MprA|nr:response regulator transcription factor [Anaerolineaceae bacterium]HOG77780.1 response regulator transcription factor [Anaerolineaceae bacterium]